MAATTTCFCGNQIVAPLDNEDDFDQRSLINDASSFPATVANGSVDPRDDGGVRRPATATSLPPVPIQHQVLCLPCAARLLSPQISRYHASLEHHGIKKNECHRRLVETGIAIGNNVEEGDADGSSTRLSLPDPNQINNQVSQLKQRLDMLRSLTNDLAVRVTAKTMENDEREEQLQFHLEKVTLAKERLDRMKQCLLLSSAETEDEKKALEDAHGRSINVGGGIRDALVSGTRQIQSLRFQFALRVFDMHRIDVGEFYSNRMNTTESVGKGVSSNDKSTVTTATGVGKIGGLPLPHAGPALYGVLPPGVLASSLRLVASLTNLVARCLGVILPHPILLCARECEKCGEMFNFDGDVIDMAKEDSLTDNATTSVNICNSCTAAESFVNDEQKEIAEKQPSTQQVPASMSVNKEHESTTTKSSLFSLVGSSARKAIALAKGTSSSGAYSTVLSSSKSRQMPPIKSAKQPTLSKPVKSMSPASISRRINHASFAVLLENNEPDATEFVLNPPRWKEETSENEGTGDGKSLSSQHGRPISRQNSPIKPPSSDHTSLATQTYSNREDFHIAEERFSTGLQLLQNDVVALCFRAGVDVSTLWPAESVLLNLHALLCHCRKMVDSR